MLDCTHKTDAQIQHDVLSELRWDSRIDETDVGVTVHGGIVTLSGTVASYPKKLAAKEAAHRVIGVRDVANELEVRVPGEGAPSDSEIAAAVRNALVWDIRVPHAKIQSTVTDGIVTLEGVVDYTSQREDAARAIGSLAGVRAVINEIVVFQPVVAPHALRASIEAALERQVHREVKRIQLDVVDGKVTVTGAVRSRAEHDAVIGAAWGTRGVQLVVDQLHIDPLAP
jgi:osmotically-inducible protein OsmY